MKSFQEFSNLKIKVEDLLNQKEKEYFVYFYFQLCPYCLAIKNNIKSYLLKNTKIKMYLIDFSNEEGSELLKNIENDNYLNREEFINEYSSANIGKSLLKDIGYYYVPMVLHIKEKKIERCLVLGDKILEYLKDYE